MLPSTTTVAEHSLAISLSIHVLILQTYKAHRPSTELRVLQKSTKAVTCLDRLEWLATRKHRARECQVGTSRETQKTAYTHLSTPLSELTKSNSPHGLTRRYRYPIKGNGTLSVDGNRCYLSVDGQPKFVLLVYLALIRFLVQ